MSYHDLYEHSINKYTKRTPSSQKAYESAKEYMTGGETRSIVFFKPHPLAIERGEGAYLYDIDGNRYIDLLNNYTSMIHGHSHKKITDAVRSVLDKGVCYGAAIPEQINLSKMLCERVPSIERVRFCNSGTEAVLFAIRAARAYTGKSAIIKMEGCFHGSCDVVQYSIAPKLPHEDLSDPWKPYPDSLGNSKNVAKDVFIAPFNNADVVENILKAKASKIAAIILEPIMGQTGAIAAKPQFLKRLRELADEYDVLLIFDEIQCLRVDYGGAQSKYGVIPDLTAVGKWIGGGYPIAAFGGREEIMNVYNPQRDTYISHSGTFNGNRLGMAAGIASMELLDKMAIDRINKMGEQIQAGIQKIILQLNLPISVAQQGSLLHVHFTEDIPIDYETTKSQYSNYSKIMHLMLLNRGIFIAPRGSMNISTVMTDIDVETTIEVYANVFKEMAPLFN